MNGISWQFPRRESLGRDGLHMCATEQCKMGRVKVGRDF